jgi:hypothetical protein
MDLQAVRPETLHDATVRAVEVMVREMVFVGSKAVAKGSVPGTNPFDQFLFHKQIEDPIYRHPVDVLAPAQRFIYFLRAERRGAVAYDLHHPESSLGVF